MGARGPGDADVAVGAVDGRVGIVVATQSGKQDVTAPAKPIVRILTDAEGVPTPLPTHVNLAQCDGLHVVRGLATAEGQKVLAAPLSLLAAA